MEVAVRRISEQRIRRCDDPVAEVDLQALVQIFGLHHRMRNIDPDLVALPVAGRDEIDARCVAPEERIDKGVIVGRPAADVDPDARARFFAPDRERADVGQVIESSGGRAGG
jgi:hypothetical protein